MASNHLIGIALQQLMPGAVSVARFSGTTAVAIDPSLGLVTPAINFLQSRFTDQSARLTKAIEAATDRAWRALELVLAGDSIWDRLKGALVAGDVKAFKHDVRGLLAAAGVNGEYPVDRRAAAKELRAARKAGHLQPTGLTPAGMVESLGTFQRFDDPASLAAAQWKATEAVAADLTTQGYPALAAVAGFHPTGATLPLLGVAVRYFFRRAVEQDAELARGLAFARMESLAETQQNHFESLNKLITEQTDQLDAALGELAAEVAEVKAVALDIRAEQDKLGNQNREIMEAILAMQAKLDQVGRAAVRAGDSLSVRTDGERELVKKVIAQYRAMPEAARQARPALKNAVGMLEVAAGEYASARSTFAAVAEAVQDPTAKGAAHLNAYRAALEARDWATALRELMAAAKCDGRKFAPFPVGKYVPQKILGAGGFGVAFLCKHKYMDAQIVVKTLTGGMDRDFEAVFAEARAASAIQHAGIVRVTDCAYAEPLTKDRPFVVMDYFPGQALDDYVREKGAISFDELIPLVRSLADALLAAHNKGILHRDVKPANILVRKVGTEFETRVIDFGLAVKHRVGNGSTSPSRSSKTLAGESIAGTIEYAAPEQMGRNPAKVAPYSDIYGWGKTCCFALFLTAQPTLRHWQGIPAGLASLLGRCLEEEPKERPQSFADVIAELDALMRGSVPIVEAKTTDDGPRSRRTSSRRRDDDDDDLPQDQRRGSRSRQRGRDRERQEGGFPAWAGVLIGLGILCAVAVAVVAMKKKEPEVATETPDKSGQNNIMQSTGPKPVPVPGPTPGPNFGPSKGSGFSQPALPPLPSSFREAPASGGFIGQRSYREFRQDGSLLIGFEVGTGRVGQTTVIDYLRPIYRTSTGGEQLGTPYGPDHGQTTTVKARDGYVLAGMVTAGGGHLEGICFTFMKIDGDSLDSNDSYVSDWFGEQSRKPQNEAGMRSGDGVAIVGIHGKRFENSGFGGPDDGAICTIGVVFARPRVGATFNPPKKVDTGDPKIDPKTQPKNNWTWPGTPPSPRPDLPNGWKHTQALGGIAGRKDYREMKSDGSVLIGFEVGLGESFGRESIGYLRPIWRTPAGEMMGTTYGKKPASTWMVKGKDGYALGGVMVSERGLHLNGICFTFMKAGEKELNPDEWYVSEWYGDQGAKPKTDLAMRAGDGSPVVGIHGKRGDDNDPVIATLGLVIAPKGELTLANTSGPAPLVIPVSSADLPPNWKESKTVGGIFGDTNFRECRLDGSILVGFEVGLGKAGNTDVVTYLRPIWLNAKGEEMGTAYGKKPANVTTLRAKENYAVCGIVVAGGGAMEGISLNFTKIVPKKGLSTNLKEVYSSEWLGEQSRKGSGDAQSVVGGLPIVGIHGKRFEDKGGDAYNNGGAICTLGLIVPPKVEGWQLVAPGGVSLTPAAPASLPQLAGGKLERTALLGGGGTAFDDAAPPGGWLVGIEVQVGKFIGNDVVAGVRPVFQVGDKTSDGEKHGKQTDKVVRAVAKAGYAVGAINVKAGAGLDGVSVTFMKVKGNKLDPTDSYESEWIGGQGGGSKTKLGGDGSAITGIHGKVNPEDHASAIGLLYVKSGN